MSLIHKPGKKFSNVPFGHPNNPMTFQHVSENILIVTEFWDSSLPQPVSLGDDNGYKLAMTWEVGKNYAVTKVVDGKDNIISYYVDICSPVKRNGDIFEFVDWYLDVEKYPNKKPKLLDEDEFEKAIKMGYLTDEDIKIARETVEQVMKMLKDPQFI